MNARKIIIKEGQIELISNKYPVDTKKVLLVKKYLDRSFRKGTMPYVSGKGIPEDMPIVLMVNSSGETVRTMTKEQLFYLLQSRFNEDRHLFADREKCDRFLKFVIDKWFNNEIDGNGQTRHSNLY